LIAALGVAVIGSLSGVNAHVFDEGGIIGELFVTFRAGIRLLLPWVFFC
jgi:hypothetical protein